MFSAELDAAAADQPFWGARLAVEHLGPTPIRASRLTTRRARHALASLDTYRAAVGAAAERMLAEDGTGKAVDVLEGIVGTGR